MLGVLCSYVYPMHYRVKFQPGAGFDAQVECDDTSWAVRIDHQSGEVDVDSRVSSYSGWWGGAPAAGPPPPNDGSPVLGHFGTSTQSTCLVYVTLKQ
jgi:hypothetical protein